MSRKHVFHKSRAEPIDNRAGNGNMGAIHLGMAQSGKVVNEHTAMSLSAVFACVRVLSEDIAALPLHTFRYTEDGDSAPAHDHPLYQLLYRQPNPEMTSFTFRQTMMVSLLLWGNAYAQIVRDGRGQVTALYPLAPNRMSIARNTAGLLIYQYERDDDEATPGTKQKAVLLKSDDVLHIVGMSYDGIVGISPLALSRDCLGLALAAQEYGARFFSNGGTPAGLLTTDKVLKDPEKQRERWMQVYGGTSNAGKIAVLEEGLDFKPISSSPEEAQLLDTRKFSVTEIARIFRVPPHLVGDLSAATFSNIENQALQYVKFTLMPWIIRWEQALCTKLLLPSEQSSMHIRFQVDGLMRGDYQTRMGAYSTGIQNGFMSPNDVRRLENMNCIPDPAADKYFFNGTLIPIDLAAQGANYPKSRQAGGEKEVE
jgi:HK97 family phage portal protein